MRERSVYLVMGVESNGASAYVSCVYPSRKRAEDYVAPLTEIMPKRIFYVQKRLLM